LTLLVEFVIVSISPVPKFEPGPVSYCQLEPTPEPAAPLKSSLNSVVHPAGGPGTVAGRMAAFGRAGPGTPLFGLAALWTPKTGEVVPRAIVPGVAALRVAEPNAADSGVVAALRTAALRVGEPNAADPGVVVPGIAALSEADPGTAEISAMTGAVAAASAINRPPRRSGRTAVRKAFRAFRDGRVITRPPLPD
jgi:hypothetical protein